MGRKQRVWLPDLYYHVTTRGNRRDPLFRSREDFKVFLYILQQLYDKIPYEVIAYCLMTNHYHLQLRSPHESLSKLMAFINKRYANYYNTKYKLTGHVFEKRYFSDPIEDRKGMFEVSRYIHLNPCRANIVTIPSTYEWSSYSMYTELSPSKFPKWK
ncbi:transposase [Peribacillus acanthi]|uniref:transposase n=1 Tax=Peribacillus acanthi TaxID=2171554 RepID=UPI000D3E4659|nr:transposase [Peribacillus acanthi]